MIDARIDEDAYPGIAEGLVRRVIRSLIGQFVDHGLIDLGTELPQSGVDLVFDTAFGVFVQFEDTRGHQIGDCLHPAVVGFMNLPVSHPPKPGGTETVIVSRKRTHLHGAVDDALIRGVFAEMRRP
jgi:hypothetical protein